MKRNTAALQTDDLQGSTHHHPSVYDASLVSEGQRLSVWGDDE